MTNLDNAINPTGVKRKPWGTYSKFKGAADKEAKIAGFIKRKETSIKNYTDAKSMSIAISSAFNMSAERCNALVSVGKLNDENYWEAHESYYQEYLDRFLGAQNEAPALMAEQNTKAADFQGKVREEAIDIAGGAMDNSLLVEEGSSETRTSDF